MKWIQDSIWGTCQLNDGEGGGITLEALMSEVGSVIPGGVRKLRPFDTHGHRFGVVGSDTYLQRADFEIVVVHAGDPWHGAAAPCQLRTLFEADRALQVTVWREDEKITEQGGLNPILWSTPSGEFAASPRVRSNERLRVSVYPMAALHISQDGLKHADLRVKIDVVRRVE